ncbi:nucleoside phosphorylase [Syntrophotalea carbinolica]|uniref:nucleoside phosphorylase n=1 Tax=Syntrophotalea carbinolica TaxID=19 RepID=UPI0002F2859D|nr:nucleoside phosphorylase [Syntrophotalea carbinolica]
MTDNPPLYHIGFCAEDLGPTPPTTALLCGAPERARQIAMASEGVSCQKTLSENRGLNSYLLTLDTGQPLLAATSGMGAPSLSIVVNELYSVGIRRIIRVGTCGSIQEHVKVGSVVISYAALCRQGAANDIAPVEYPAAADPYISVALGNAAARLHIDHHLGLTASVDSFYEGQERVDTSANRYLMRQLQGITEEYRRLNILNYEMEAGTLFKMAGVYGFSAGCVCGVLAGRTASEAIDGKLKDQAQSNAIRVALEAVRHLENHMPA